MERNAYNEKIQKQLKSINEIYLKHQDETGKQVLESNKIPLVHSLSNYKGTGFLSSLLGNIGLGKGEEEEEVEVKKKRGRPAKKPLIIGNGNGLKSRPIGSGKEDTNLGLFKYEKEGSGILSGPTKKTMLAGSTGTVAHSEKLNLLTGQGKRGRPSKKTMVAGNFFDDIVNTVGNVVKNVVEVAPAAISLISKLKGGKKVAGQKLKGGKKTSPWIEHLKAYSKKHKMKYSECLKNRECIASYKKK